MTLIQHPGSDRQVAVISIDTGLARDIMLMLTDAHALIEALASGQVPAAARQAAAALRDADSPCTPASLAAALDQTATWLHQARRNALAGLRPAPDQHDPRVPGQCPGISFHFSSDDQKRKEKGGHP